MDRWRITNGEFLGTDFASVVEELGVRVDAFRVGDAVFGRTDPPSAVPSQRP